MSKKKAVVVFIALLTCALAGQARAQGPIVSVVSFPCVAWLALD